MKFSATIVIVLAASGSALGSWTDWIREVTVTETATKTIQSYPCHGEVRITPVVRGQDFPNSPGPGPRFGPFGPHFPAAPGKVVTKAGPIVAVYSTAGTITTKTGIVIELEPTPGGHGPGLTTTIWTGARPTDDLAWIDWNPQVGDDASTLTRTQTKFTTIYGSAPTNAEHEPWSDWLGPPQTTKSSISTKTSTSKFSSSSAGVGPAGGSTTSSATTWGYPTNPQGSSSSSVLSTSSSSDSGSGIGSIGSFTSSSSSGTSSPSTSTSGGSAGGSTTSSSSLTSASLSTLTSSTATGNSNVTSTSITSTTSSSSSSNGVGPIGGNTTTSLGTSSSAFTSISMSSVSATSTSTSDGAAGSTSVSTSGSSTSSSSSVTSDTSSTSSTTLSTTTSIGSSATTSSSSVSLLSTSTTFTSTSTTAVQGAVVTDDVRSLSYNDAILEAHNVHRRNHSAADLTWSDNLATIAAQIAASCVYGHNTTAGGGGYGQNIGAGYTSSQVPIMIGDDMYNKEMPNYPLPYGLDDVDTSNFDSWGHFSQIVWKGTQEVGCATQFCPNGVEGAEFTQYFTVCNYYPPGNIQGAYSNVGAPLGQPITVELTN